MRFCTKCGKQLEEDAKFCENCGAGVPKESILPNETPVAKKKKKSKVVIILCLALVVVLLVHIAKTTIPKGFRVEYSEEGIEEYLEDVCERVNGEARVVDPDTDSPGSMYGGCFVSTVEVKRSGKIAEEVQIRFYNEGSSDTVNKVQMILYSFEGGSFYARDYENLFACEKELLIALEKTIAGHSNVEKHITSYEEVRSRINYFQQGVTAQVVKYNLTDTITVTIKVENGSWSGDRVYYILEKA